MTLEPLHKFEITQLKQVKFGIRMETEIRKTREKNS